MTDEVTVYLLEPSHLGMALDIASRRDELARRVVNQYWLNVEEQLRDFLGADRSSKWQIAADRADESDSSLGFWIGEPPTDDEDGYRGYWIGFGALAGIPESLYVGVYRGRAADQCRTLPSAESEISRILGDKGLTESDENHLGWQRARQLGLGSISLKDDTVIVALNSDNHRAEHPKAVRTAKSLWGVFVVLKPLIEAAVKELK